MVPCGKICRCGTAIASLSRGPSVKSYLPLGFVVLCAGSAEARGWPVNDGNDAKDSYAGKPGFAPAL